MNEYTDLIAIHVLFEDNKYFQFKHVKEKKS